MKLTETTKDQLAQKEPGISPVTNGTGGIGNSYHIVPPHEPLYGEPFTPFPVIGGVSQFDVAPAPEPQVLKVACIGTAPSSRMLAPFADPSWQIWGCSPGNKGVLPRADVWFEIHDDLLFEENKEWGPSYVDWLSKLTIPVFMQDQRYFSHAKSLPVQEMIKEFGPHVFTSSFSWMMAHAMMQGAKEISLYGIDMASRQEYILQRQAAYHFIYVEGPKRGVKITAPHESDIMQPPALYGFSEATPFGSKLRSRAKELTGRVGLITNQIAQIEAQLAQKRHEKAYLEGALEDCDYQASIWGGVQHNKGLTA